MTYSPAQAGVMTGEEYFTSIGLIGGSTGMKPILSMPTVLSTPDGYRDGSTATATDSVVVQTGANDAWVNWNFLDSGSTSYSKALAICYGYGIYFAITVSENEYSGATAGAYIEDCYHWRSYGKLYSRVGATWSNFATDSTLVLNQTTAYNPLFGMALYLETDQVQKTFLRSGSHDWVQILSTTDSATGSNGFKSVGVYSSLDAALGTAKHVVAPVMAWGVE